MIIKELILFVINVTSELIKPSKYLLTINWLKNNKNRQCYKQLTNFFIVGKNIHKQRKSKMRIQFRYSCLQKLSIQR